MRYGAGAEPERALTILTLEDARWDCGMCGFCCTFVTLGPVEPEIIRGLEARGIRGDWPAAAAGWFTERAGQHFLTRRDGACVFLRPDRRCAVHALYGAEAKPGFCREFPHRAVAVGGDVAVVVRGDCSGAHEHFRDGAPVAERAPGVLSLSRVAPRDRFAPEQVEVLPGHAVALKTWLGWERELLDELSGARLEPQRAVALLRERLAERVGARLTPPEPAKLRLAGRAVLEGLALVTERAVRQGRSRDGSPAEVSFARENLARIRKAQAGWEQLEPLSEDSLDYLNLLLRSELLGKQVHAAGGLAPGMGRFLLGVRVARVAGGGQLGALAGHLSRFLRFTNNRAALEVLRLARPALTDMALNAGSG